MDIKKTELFVELESFEDFINLLNSYPYLKDSSYISSILNEILTKGIFDPLTDNFIPPEDILVRSDNYRETIYANGLISRTRAVLLVFKNFYKKLMPTELQKLKIYFPEAITPFALYMKGKFPFSIGSEFGKNPQEFFPINIEDIQNLSFTDESFDCVIVNDVFEHLPFLDKALKELYRILKFNGILISTFPFAYMKNETMVKAKLHTDGRIEYYTEPEYHGNPVDPGKGSLVFQILAWDIIYKIKFVGFSFAKMIFIVSAKFGILSPNISGCFVCLAKK